MFHHFFLRNLIAVICSGQSCTDCNRGAVLQICYCIDVGQCDISLRCFGSCTFHSLSSLLTVLFTIENIQKAALAQVTQWFAGFAASLPKAVFVADNDVHVHI